LPISAAMTGLTLRKQRREDSNMAMTMSEQVSDAMPQTFHEALGLILDEMREVMIAKQLDYGPGNILDFGDLGVLVRANDKMARLRNLYQTGDAPRNETVDDSWIDLANYAVIAQMVRRGFWGLPLEVK